MPSALVSIPLLSCQDFLQLIRIEPVTHFAGILYIQRSLPNSMDQVRIQTEQLRIEAQVSRKKVSEVSKDLIEYCEREKQHDMLVSGPIDNHNPFQEKKSCAVL
ncbi:unnamed protein product [Wuchereria bancrofti]|uniref:Guanine nucleotide-binding protein subunit gamma n=2 Tax=Wuchereria bancrofti TaxID=6293 RepID=A0A3P7E2L3_WUCBA|nr:unnamed protein product [Wuchereria bancrofti]